MKELLARAIADLPEKERQVLALYYYEELTMKEVGAVLGVGESRVSQIHSMAVVRLRARLSELTGSRPGRAAAFGAAGRRPLEVSEHDGKGPQPGTNRCHGADGARRRPAPPRAAGHAASRSGTPARPGQIGTRADALHQHPA